MATKVISFTPVRVDPETLELHLASLDEQGLAGHFFYDDNDNPDSSALLIEWVAARDHAKVLPSRRDLPQATLYDRAAVSHVWDKSSVARVAMIKNSGIAAFLTVRADALLLIDADVVPAPGSVAHMAETGLPIVCGIYWTVWESDASVSSPNVWDQHPNSFAGDDRFAELRVPGHYEVGGLGAFTLIDRRVLATGKVNFNSVRGVPYFGEDRHFCIRASALDIPLTACSHIEAFHVYRLSEIPEAQRWWHEIHSLSG